MRFLSFVLAFAALSTSTVTAQDASACPNPTPYQAVPMQLNGANVGTAIDALRNDGMINPTNSTAGWCTSTDINACPNPLGFQKGSFPPDNSPPFCFGLTGIKNRMVEIMIETIAAGDRICVTDTGANTIETQNAPLVNLCGNGQVRACFAASSLRDTLPLSISCADGNSCSTSDTNFWYRVRVSNVDWVTAGDNVGTNSANMQPDMWCEMIKGNEMSRFPSQLAVVNERPVAQATMAPRSDASTTTSSLLIPLAASVAAYVGMRA